MTGETKRWFAGVDWGSERHQVVFPAALIPSVTTIIRRPWGRMPTWGRCHEPYSRSAGM